MVITSSGYRYILNCIDMYTRIVEYIPLKDISAGTVAKSLFDHIFCRYEVCKTISSDQGSNFMAAVMRALCKIRRVKMQFLSAYHPQSQGQVERDHKVLTDHLAKYIKNSGLGEDWDDYLAPAAFVHNNTVRASL